MSGVTIIGALLGASAAVIAEIPATRIKAGRLPEDIDLTALLVRLVSSIDRQKLDGTTDRVTERVSVAVRASSYREQRVAIALIRAACAGFVGDVAGFSRVSVLTAGLGPDVNGPGNSFEQTQDFRVSFDQAA